MFAKARHIPLLFAAPLLSLTACAGNSDAQNTAERAAFTPEKLLAACETRDGWSDAAPPARIHGDTYYVGTCGIAAVLIDSGDGLVLIDGATKEAAPSILANIAALGFDPKQIRLLLASHEHFDHVAGLAAIQRASGALVAAFPSASAALRAGRADPSDPQAAVLDPFEPLRTEPTLQDKVPFRIGSLEITPYSTPAHAPGSASYSWESCIGGDCKTIAFMDSISTPPRAFSFSDHPDQQARVIDGLKKAAAIRCDILITPHPSASSLFDRLGGKAPLAEANACARYAADGRQVFENRLAKEKE